MAFGKEEAALLFKIKADTSEADRALASLDAKTGGLGDSLGSLSGGIGALSGSLGPVTAAISAAAGAAAALAAAAVQVGSALFSLSQQAAEYGSKLKDAADKTGLSATSLSALKIAADQSGSSLEQVAGSVSKFSKTVGDAANGSQEAAKKLKLLGVEPQEAIADLDGALAKVFQRIVDAKPGVEQTTLATSAFGKAGADMIPVLKSFDGDMAALIKKAEDLGVVFDDVAAGEADEFGDTMDDLDLAVKGLGMTIGRELIPEITEMARSFTQFISSNRAYVQNWAADTAVYLRGVVRAWNDAAAAARRYMAWADAATSGAAGKFVSDRIGWLAPGLSVISKYLYGKGSEYRAADDEGTFIPGTRPGANPFPSGGDGGGGRRRGGGGGGDRTGNRDLGARIQYAQNELSRLRELYRRAIDAFVEEFQRTGNAEVFDAAVKQANEKWVQMSADVLQQIGALEDQQVKKEKKTAGEIAVLNQERQKRWEKVLEDEKDTLKRAEEEKTRQIKKSADERTKIDEEEFRRKMETARSLAELAIAQAGYDRDTGQISEVEYQQKVARERLGLLEDEKKLLKLREQTAEVLQRIKILDNELSLQQIENAKLVGDAIEELNRRIGGEDGATAGERDKGENADSAGESRGGWLAQVFGGFDFGIAIEKMTSFKDVATEVGTMVTQIFQQMGAAVGSMVQNWVLLGGAADMSMKKMLASVLAGVAAQAATLSIFHLAMGLAALTPWGAAMYGSPALHFKAAALWGGIAVGTALAGRAVAGNAFKHESERATGANTQGSRSGSGGAYSTQGQMTVKGGRNAPAGIGGTIVIKDRSGMFSRLFEMEWQNNGLIRQTLMREFST